MKKRATSIEIEEMCNADFRHYGLNAIWQECFVIEDGIVWIITA